MIRIQEKIWEIKPDIIIETGVAHGGSLVYYASLCKAMDHGRVIGIDIEIRPHNRRKVEEHQLADFISLVEGNSISPDVVRTVSEQIPPGARVMVILDSCHTRDHVSKEMELYSPLVSTGSYLVVTDGIMKNLAGVPRGKASWNSDNPYTAIQDFLKTRDDFVQEEVPLPFNESTLSAGITHWPAAYLKRMKR